MKAVHGAGMMHKDVKSENVLLTAGGRVAKLADLGVSQVDDLVVPAGAQAAPNAVQDGIKDFCWASPEELGHVFHAAPTRPTEDDHKAGADTAYAYRGYHVGMAVTPASDVYATGWVFVHIIMERLPWQVMGLDVKQSQQQEEWFDLIKSGEAATRILALLPADHPLTPCARQCLTYHPQDRPTAAQLERTLLSPDVLLRCHGGALEAARVALGHHHRLLVYASGPAREQYQAPWVTPVEQLERVVELKDDEKEETPLENVVDWLTAWRTRPAARSAVLLGDGGTGKSLTADVMTQLALEDTTGPWSRVILIQVRPAFTEWSVAALARGGIQACLQHYDLSPPMIRALTQVPVIFWVDAYDELTGGPESERNVASLLGLDQPPWGQARLVITCRRHIVPPNLLTSRFGLGLAAPEVRYMLPFGVAHMRRRLRHQLDSAAVEQLLSHAASRQVLENPFLLQLYASTLQGDVAPVVSSPRQVYDQAVKHWTTQAEQQLAVVRADLQADYPSVEASFRHFAQQAALRMFAADTVQATLEDSASAWRDVATLLRVAAQQQYGDAVGRLVTLQDYVALQVGRWQQLAATCPLQLKSGDRWSFRHKTFRDYFVSTALADDLGTTASWPALLQNADQVAQQLPIAQVLLTQDAAVLDFVAQFVRPGTVASRVYQPCDAQGVPHWPVQEWSVFEAYARTVKVPGGPEPWQPQALTKALCDLVEMTKHHGPEAPRAVRVAGANALYVLNTAGVAFPGWNLRGIQVGALPHEVEWDEKDVKEEEEEEVQASLAAEPQQGAELEHRQDEEEAHAARQTTASRWPPRRLKRAFAELGGLDVRDADLRDACLRGVHLESAVLDGADLRGAQLEAVDFSQWPFLEGHRDKVMAVALDAASGTLVSGSADKTVRVWDLASGQCRKVLEGHSDWVRAVALDAASGTLVSGSFDKTVRVWDLASGQCRKVLEGHSGQVMAVALDAASGTLVSGSADKTVRVWDLASGQCRKVLEGHSGIVSSAVNAVALDAASGTLVSGSGDMTVRVWDLVSGQCRKVLEGHRGLVRAVALDAASGTLVSGSSDKTVRVWDLASGQCRKVLEGHDGAVRAVALDAVSGTLVSGLRDQTVRVWDLASGQCRKVLEGHSGEVNAVALDVASGALVSGSDDKTVRLWDLASGQCRKVLEGHSGEVMAVALDTASGTLVSGSFDETVRVWDLASGQCRKVLKGHRSAVWAVALAAASGTLVSGSGDQTVRVWDLASGQCRKVLKGHSSDVWAVALDAASGTLVSGSLDNTVRVWDVASGQCRKVLEGHSGAVRAVALDAASGTLVSGSDDATVRVWDLASGQCLEVEEDARLEVVTAAGMCVVGGDDGRIRIYHTGAGSTSSCTLLWSTMNMLTLQHFPSYGFNDNECVWTAPPLRLSAQKCQLSGAHLSQTNQRLLAQHGAVSETAPSCVLS